MAAMEKDGWGGRRFQTLCMMDELVSRSGGVGGGGACKEK